MTRQERLDTGEKIFVGAFVGSIVIEVLLTLFALTLTPGWNTFLPWTILVLGVVFVGFLLYLANWLYSGDLTAWTTSLGWAVFQIALAVAFIIALLTSNRLAAYLGMSLIWLAIIKALTYAAFAGSLALPKSVQDFLGLRRGETIAEETQAVAGASSATAPPTEEQALLTELETRQVTPSVPLPLTDVQAGAFGSLATWLQVAGGLLILAGILRFYVGLLNIEPSFEVKKFLPGLPSVIEGIAAALLGIVLFTPAGALKLVRGREMTHLLDAFKSLQLLYLIQLVLVGVVAVAIFLGIASLYL